MPRDHRHDQPSHTHKSSKVSLRSPLNPASYFCHDNFITFTFPAEGEVPWRQVPQVSPSLALQEPEPKEERSRGEGGGAS